MSDPESSMTTKHTPGPWTIGDGDSQLPLYVYAEDQPEGARLVACVSDSKLRDRFSLGANARLIAASPTLLEAAAASIEAIKQGEADIALIYLRHAIEQAVKGGAK